LAGTQRELVRAEDIPLGVEFALGAYVVTEEEILAFSRQWDPQDWHLDPDVAAVTPFGGIIASGIHSLAIFQRLSVLGLFSGWAVIAGRTVRDVQLVKPVRPGATLEGFITATDCELRRPGTAMVTTYGELRAEGGLVLSAVFDVYVATAEIS